MKTKLQELLVVVEEELLKAERNYREAKKSASEVAASAALSPSQAGDRFHSEGTANLVRNRFEALKKLKGEVESGKAHFIEKGGENFYLVKNVTLLPGINLISVDSPVGKKMVKDVGQS